MTSREQPAGTDAQTENYDVVVIGAGVSGMYALHHLREIGLSVRVYDGPATSVAVILEDMTLRNRLLGRIETSAYLARALATVPYGRGSTLRHVVGGTTGGGFEWTAPNGLVGITAIELDTEGLVSRITSVYDGRQVPRDRKAELLSKTFAA